jgi:HEAT repeat protein
MSQDINALKRALLSSDPAQQAAAAEKLAQLGEDAQPAAVELVRACADEALCEWTTAALEGLGAPAGADVSRLIPLLNDKSSDVAYWAATLLGRAGPEAASATPALAEALSESLHANVRERAALALGKIGPAAKAAAPALTAAASGGTARLASLAREALAVVQP